MLLQALAIMKAGTMLPDKELPAFVHSMSTTPTQSYIAVSAADYDKFINKARYEDLKDALPEAYR